MLNILPKFELEPIKIYLGGVLHRTPALDDSVAHDAEIMLKQHEIRRLFGDVRGAVDGDTNVGRVQCGSVVDAVAEKAHDPACVLQGEENALLLLRGDAAE
jgi:hypothetical protein